MNKHSLLCLEIVLFEQILLCDLLLGIPRLTVCDNYCLIPSQPVRLKTYCGRSIRQASGESLLPICYCVTCVLCVSNPSHKPFWQRKTAWPFFYDNPQPSCRQWRVFLYSVIIDMYVILTVLTVWRHIHATYLLVLCIICPSIMKIFRGNNLMCVIWKVIWWWHQWKH